MSKTSADKEFKLSSKFLYQFIGKQPNWGYGGLGYLTYKRTYARPLPSGGTEEFWHTCKRVVEGVINVQRLHCLRLKTPWDSQKAAKTAEEMYLRMWQFKWLPPGRGLWMMGTKHVSRVGGAACNNCGFISTENLNQDFADPFCWLMDMSMLGVGVGFDVKGAGKVKVRRAPYGEFLHYEIPDTREGWVESVRLLLNEYVNSGYVCVFDYSKIRPAGEPIRGFGGIASGPEPLKELHENLHAILSKRVGDSITVTDIVDICNLIGKCVVSGNVRRTAEIAFGSPDSDEYLHLKDPDLHKEKYKVEGCVYMVGENVFAGKDQALSFAERQRPLLPVRQITNPVFDTHEKAWDVACKLGTKKISAVPSPLLSHRWASNNSVFAERGMDYAKVAAQTVKNGEPGYMWLDNAQCYGRMKDGKTYKDMRARGGNPCLEQTLEDHELCCLVETFPSLHDTVEDYHTTLKYAYLYAKTVTLIPTHNERTNAVLLRNRRIGLSQSGITQAIDKHGARTFLEGFCDQGYKTVRKWDKIYSEWLCVPESIKVTSVKPSGTVSLLAGVSPGVHYPHSKYYIRRVRLPDNSTLIAPLKRAGYNVCRDVYDKRSLVVDFIVCEPGTRFKEDVSMWEQLELAAQMQHYWADNQVSATVTIPVDENNKEKTVQELTHALSYYETRLKGISFLPLSNHGYAQAPYEAISAEEYEEAIKHLTDLKLEDLGTHEAEDRFCDGESCEIPKK